tara:strand:+ start:1693 stop:1863 length:171 start_codon:yes stop_codon:yes gene_type:complete
MKDCKFCDFYSPINKDECLLKTNNDKERNKDHAIDKARTCDEFSQRYEYWKLRSVY